MTDARYPERWLNDRRLIRLTDGQYRTFTMMLIWSVANRTDGFVHPDDIGMVHGADPDDVPELIAAGLWEPAPDGFVIVDFASTQTSREQLAGFELKKDQDRLRAKAYRARKHAKEDPESSRLLRDASRDDIGQARTGQEGQDRTGFSGGTTSNLGKSAALAPDPRCDTCWLPLDKCRCPT